MSRALRVISVISFFLNDPGKQTLKLLQRLWNDFQIEFDPEENPTPNQQNVSQ